MPRIRFMIVILITLFAIMLFPLSEVLEIGRIKAPVKADMGIMDLSKWDPEKNKIITLNGEWEFYWNQLITPEELSDQQVQNIEPDYMDVPSIWKGKTIDDQTLPAYGSATYRLKLINLPSEGVFALKKTNIRFASTIYVNGEKLLEDGRPTIDAESFELGNTSQLGLFTSEGNELEIIVHVSNHQYWNAGIPTPIYFGESDAVLKYQQQNVAWGFSLLGILGGLSVIYFFCFVATIFYRSLDLSLLASSVICFLFAIYNGLVGERPLLLFMSDVSYETLYRVKDIASFASFIVLTIVIYHLQRNLISLRITQAVSVVLVGFSVLGTILPLNYYYAAHPYIIILYTLVLLWLTVRVAFMFIQGEGNRLKTLFVYMGLLCINCYSFDFILFSVSYKESLWLGQVFLVAFNLLLIILVVIRFFEAYRTVEMMKNQLLKLDQIKDDFLSNTSHELKTPLNAIVNITDTMLKGASGQLSMQQTQNLSIIIESGRKLTNLVNELLDYSKMKHGNIVLNKRAIDLRTAVDSVIRIHMFLLNNKPITMVNSIPDSFPVVWADGNRLTQILHNLIGNALKFTNEGSVTIHADISRENAEIRITDTGIGIEPEMLERIFLSYEQAVLSDDKFAGGSGLGLSITKKLVELHGGKIYAASGPDNGSEFVFTLPLADLADQEIAATIKGEQGTRILPGKGELTPLELPLYAAGTIHEPILVVDDDFANLQTMINLLRLEGYTFTVVDSGHAALEEIMHNPTYSLLILDIMMPDLSGYEVLKRLRERFSPFELPVLMLTARNRLEDVRLSLEYGANDIVGKPFELEGLVARIRSLTKLKRSVKNAKDAEISFLRSQIKPHFLYNALNSIAELCVDEPRQAEQLIVQLSQYLRRSFDFKQLTSYTTLASELELIRAYVRIEQVRFGSRLNVEVDVEVDESIQIPPLLLQPLVENAIRHGLMSDMKGGTVKISAKMLGKDFVRLMIEDDGCGMSQQKLQEVLQGEDESSGVGLWNIRKHLKLIYGTNIHIESAVGVGTKISFHIPFEGGRLADA